MGPGIHDWGKQDSKRRRSSWRTTTPVIKFFDVDKKLRSHGDSANCSPTDGRLGARPWFHPPFVLASFSVGELHHALDVFPHHSPARICHGVWRFANLMGPHPKMMRNICQVAALGWKKLFEIIDEHNFIICQEWLFHLSGFLLFT